MSVLCRRFSSTTKLCTKAKSIPKQVPQKSAADNSLPTLVECNPIIIPSRTNRRHRRLTYVSANKFHLPAEHDWRAAFPTTGAAFKNRVSLRNYESAMRVAEAFVPAGCRDKVIVEAFPGMTLLYVDTQVQHYFSVRPWCIDACVNEFAQGTRP